jgi:hypothetical protein
MSIVFMGITVTALCVRLFRDNKPVFLSEPVAIVKLKDFKSTPLLVLKSNSDCPEREECKKRDPSPTCPPIEWRVCPLLKNHHGVEEKYEQQPATNHH